MTEEALFSEWMSRMDQQWAAFDTYNDWQAAQEAPVYTFDETIVSDLHKDAYGFRPSGYWWTMWEEASDLRRQEIWDDLIDALNDSMEQERQAQARAIEKFEQLVTKTIEHGARDRETAIRWIVESLDLGGYATAEYACYNLGLSYGCANMFDGILPREAA